MALSAGSRRTVACLLVGFGALLIVAAVMIPTYTVSQVAKTPLDLEITTVATNVPGEDSLVLDSSSLTDKDRVATVDKNVSLVSQRYLTVEEPSDADEMTVQAGSTLRRNDKMNETGLLTASIDVVTIDRKDGMPVEKGNGEPNGSIAVTVQADGKTSKTDPVNHTGLQYRFPIGTEKKDYPYFDLNVRKTFPIKFMEETEINSMKVYHFQQTVPATNVYEVVPAATNRLKLPAAKWGVEGEGDVQMDRFYTNTRDVWVEPQTGTVIKGGEQLHLFYARSGDKPEVTALKSHLVFNEKTVESQIDVAKENIDKLSLFARIVPIVLGVLGAILLIVGAIIGFTGGGSTPATAGGGLRQGGGQGARRPGADDAPTEQIRINKNL